jgi:hypothetical protein
MVGLPGRGISPTQGQHHTEKRGHIYMPRAGFEPVIPVLDRAAIGTYIVYNQWIQFTTIVCTPFTCTLSRLQQKVTLHV